MTISHDLPGAEAAVSSLVAAYRNIVTLRRGRIVFVVGGAGSGRSALLRAMPSLIGAIAPRPAVLAGTFDASGTYEPWESSRPSVRARAVVKRLLDVGAPAATLLEGVVPYGGLLQQALSRSRAALEIAEELGAGSECPDLTTLMPRVLGGLCEESPVVCIVDDVDRALSGWWTDLVLLFARRVASELPLLLILGTDGPSELGSHEPEEANVLFAARTLHAEGLATWHPLKRVDTEEARRWTEGATPGVARALLEVTGGQAEWTAQLWRDWQRRNVVEKRDDRCWDFTAGPAFAIDEIEYRFGQRLADLLGTEELMALVMTRRLLACAALEGRRFTADAVARALDRAPDEVIGELDEKLSRDEQRPNAVVVEAGSVDVRDETGVRSLRRYRFAAELDWLALLHHGHAQDERQEMSLRLARELESAYGSETHRVAQVLVRLYRDGGDLAKAALFQRMSNVGVSRAVILWRAQEALVAPRSQHVADARMTCRILLAAANELFHTGPFDQGLEFARAAHELMPPGDDQWRALYLMGRHSERLGEHEQARMHLRAALDLAVDRGDRASEADTRHALASIDLQERDYESAHEEFTAMLTLTRALRDRDREASTRHQLATIHLEQGNYDAAREEFTTVLALHHALRDRRGEAAVRYQLAAIHVKEGNYDAAREELTTVLALHRALRDRHGEASTRHQLASIQLEQANYDGAREEFTAVLTLRRALGHRSGEAATLHQLAWIDFYQRKYDAAREGFIAALALHRELRDRRAETAARDALASIDVKQGNYDRAYEEFTVVMALRRAIGDRRGEATAQQWLAWIDAERGNYDAARQQFAAALTLHRAIGDPDGEALARRQIAWLDAEKGS
jgi:tetratricopeptide (TPR) repeat protein